MQMIFQNAAVYQNGTMTRQDAVMSDGLFRFYAPGTVAPIDDARVFSDCLILPGFCDVHVHLREPGFSYKETIETGTAAAAHGGYTAVCSMPNLNPVPDSLPHLQLQLDRIREGAAIAVYPYGSLTVSEAGEQAAALEEMSGNLTQLSGTVSSLGNNLNALQQSYSLLERRVAALENAST